MLVRVFDGTYARDKISFMATGRSHLCEQVGDVCPRSTQRESISAGQLGFVIAGIRSWIRPKWAIPLLTPKAGSDPLPPGFRRSNRRCLLASIRLKPTSMKRCAKRSKLKLNDASLHFEPEVSQALGFGFRCGFLGLLHMDVIQERLEREYDMDLVTTAPTVVYRVCSATVR